jgi:hypothetical protein
METLAFPLLVAMQPTCTQQYKSGERIHVTIRPRLLGNHATRQYRVVSVSMELFNFRLPSNDGIRPNTSHYVIWPPLWTSGQSSWLLTQAIPDFLSSSGYETGSTQTSWA